MDEWDYSDEVERRVERRERTIGGDGEIRKYLDALGVPELFAIDPEMHEAWRSSETYPEAKEASYEILVEREQWLYSLDCELDPLERSNAMNCVIVLKNFLSEFNEKRAGVSSFWYLWRLAHNDIEVAQKTKRAFVVDIMNILRGSQGKSGIHREEAPQFLQFEGPDAAAIRSDYLDRFAAKCLAKIRSYPTGLDPQVIGIRRENRRRIQDHLGADSSDWEDYRWQLANVIRSLEELDGLIILTEEERAGVRSAIENHIPFGITPYYLSLMDYEAGRKWDHAVRAQVLPPLSYVNAVLSLRTEGPKALDFMKEHATSPVGLVTRRYPMIAILKPYNTCAQICVYCQRNWEITGPLDPSALATKESISEALSWFENHPSVIEILITGGDPALMNESMVESILQRIRGMPHVERVRIGTRVPVVLPMRVNESFVDALSRFHEPPTREISIVTHVEHPYEITPELVNSVGSFRRKGMSVYNQQVFTLENSRRFETAALRLTEKRAGIDPYYTFNMKGKEETNDYRVPIARILQERKEEARVLPGLARTDEPVFNIPAIGKNYLRAWQHHSFIMITPAGERIYEFHPWEKNIVLGPTYINVDVPILDYLQNLEARGENPEDYDSIWYYF